MSGWDDMIAFAASLPQQIRAGAEQGLAGEVEALEVAAQGTRLYKDDTGATRIGTRALIDTDDADTIIGQAVEQAEGLNPGMTSVEELETDSDATTVVLTSVTSYVADLVTMKAGAHDFLGETIMAEAPALFQAGVAGIARVFEGTTRPTGEDLEG